MFSLPEGKTGVLPAQWLRKARDAGIIRSASSSPEMAIPEENFQPASLDLRLGDVAYRLQCSFLPDKQDVETKLQNYSMGELPLTEGAILEQNRPYLIPLAEELHLPDKLHELHGKANPKSSTGRLDIFTRVITDKSYQFDEIRPGYKGRLYLEVVSRSFTVKVSSGLALNQLRLVAGEATSKDPDIRALHNNDPLIFRGRRQVSAKSLPIGQGLFLSLDLSGSETDGIVGYRAKKNSHLLDLSQIRAYDADEFWEPIYHAEDQERPLILEPEEFYLLLSLEGVRVPPSQAAEMTAYDPTSGELRTHYAGFFDPGFGHGLQKRSFGSRAALEVRAHDVPFLVEHGQRVCKLRYERMLETPDILYGEQQAYYQFQIETLSKHFRRKLPSPTQLPLKHRSDNG
jgi:dCTP deaminase